MVLSFWTCTPEWRQLKRHDLLSSRFVHSALPVLTGVQGGISMLAEVIPELRDDSLVQHRALVSSPGWRRRPGKIFTSFVIPVVLCSSERTYQQSSAEAGVIPFLPLWWINVVFFFYASLGIFEPTQDFCSRYFQGLHLFCGHSLILNFQTKSIMQHQWSQGDKIG